MLIAKKKGNVKIKRVLKFLPGGDSELRCILQFVRA